MGNQAVRELVKWLLFSIAVVAALVTLALVAYGDEVEAKVGVPVVIESEKALQWKSLDDWPDIIKSDDHWCVFLSHQPGTYLLLGYTIKDGRLDHTQYWRVTVSGTLPPDPPPEPGDFEKKLQAAWTVDGGNEVQREKFIAFYTFAASKVKTYDLSVVKTVGQLKLGLAGMAKDSYWKNDAEMQTTRRVIFEWLDQPANTPLTPALLKHWSGKLAQVADYVKRLK